MSMGGVDDMKKSMGGDVFGKYYRRVSKSQSFVFRIYQVKTENREILGY